MASNYYAHEWAHGVGTGRPGALYVFPSEAERDKWCWANDPECRQAIDGRTAAHTFVPKAWVSVNAEVPKWIADDPHWLKVWQTAGLDGWDAYDYVR